MRRVFSFQPASWLAKASTIHRSTPWCSRCRCPGGGRCSSTPGACIASTPERPTFGSSISWTPAIRRCYGCGTSASAATGRWDTGSGPVDLRNDDEFSRGRWEFRVDPQQPAPVLISSGSQSAHGQPSATTLLCDTHRYQGLPAGTLALGTSLVLFELLISNKWRHMHCGRHIRWLQTGARIRLGSLCACGALDHLHGQRPLAHDRHRLSQPLREQGVEVFIRRFGRILERAPVISGSLQYACGMQIQ